MSSIFHTLRTYSGTILGFFIALLVGYVSPLAGNVIILGGVLFLVLSGKDEHLIILTLLVYMAGDSRNSEWSFAKTYRMFCLLGMFSRTVIYLVQRKTKIPAFYRWIIPFFITALVSASSSPVLSTALFKLFAFGIMLMVAFTYFPMILKKNHGALVQDIVVFILLVFASAFFLRLIGAPIVMMKDRFAGMFGNPNGLGIFATLTTCFLTIYMHINPRFRHICLWALFFGILNIVLSGSRTALGAQILFFFLYFFYQRGTRGVVFLWALLVPSVYLFFQIITPEDILISLGLGEYLRVDSLTSGSGRFLAWQVAITEITANPFFGQGFGFDEHFFVMLREKFQVTEHQGGVHNSFLTLMMNTGLVGTTLYILFLTNISLHIKKTKLLFPVMVAAMISANFEGWLPTSLGTFNIYFLLSLVLLLNYHELKAIAAKSWQPVSQGGSTLPQKLMPG
ncbi:MAG: O-antigen ligase family protein [Bacteroidota bacterium]